MEVTRHVLEDIVEHGRQKHHLFYRHEHVERRYQSKKRSTLADLQKHLWSDGSLFKLIPNAYPYACDEEFEHFVLWFNPKYFKWEQLDNLHGLISRVILRCAGQVEAFWFPNPGHFRSVGAIPHVQVFITKEDIHEDALLRDPRWYKPLP